MAEGQFSHTRQAHLSCLYKEGTGRVPDSYFVTQTSALTNLIFNNIANSLTKPSTLCLVQAPKGPDPSYQVVKLAHTTSGSQVTGEYMP